MNLADLRDLYRQRTDDQVAPYAWSDAELNELANEAQHEACRRSKLLVDSSYAPICELAVIAGDPVCDVDPRVIRILRFKLGARDLPLVRKGLRDMDCERPGWETDTGEPVAYIPDMDSGQVRLYPIPVADDFATLTVQRLPTEDMVRDDDEPEVREHLHRKLVSWMEHRGFLKPDTDRHDATRAATALAQFESEFGKPVSAKEEAWVERNADFLEDEGQY